MHHPSNNIRQIASHFILLPDGHLGKWPVITINSYGEILDVETRLSFTEKPGLELYPGILLPAFTDIFIKKSINIQSSTINFNRHFSEGTILLGCHNCHSNGFPITTEALSPQLKQADFMIRPNYSAPPMLTRIKNNTTTSLVEKLYLGTYVSASQTSYKNQLGQLSQGFKPGLLVLQGIDLINMKLTDYAKIKWLNTPSL
ncbi:hypothetical protein ACT3CD_04745 [Geofilum sp. OHC36d9]|uniref:hypothetical protein n=1 Tax=Geofilum sp. OHC36d9 TaxID=3458413 RepID=UPI00403404F0